MKVQFTQVGEASINFDNTDLTYEEFQKLCWSDQEAFLQENMENKSFSELMDWAVIQQSTRGTK
jgi:hypothetical protein